MFSDVVARWIGPDVGTTHAAEAAQWCVDGTSGCSGIDIATRVDVASVTKVFTATAALMAIDRGLVEFETPLSTAFPEAQNGQCTLAQLLNHSSGFPAWRKFYEELPFPETQRQRDSNRDAVIRTILNTAPVAPPGSVGVYSDLGYIVLGRWLERLFSKRLDAIVQDEILSPLGMTMSQFVTDAPIDALRTELDRRRPEATDVAGAVRGVVHDENCYITGGVEGHAGLFSTASDLHRFAHHMLEISNGQSGIVSTPTLVYAWDRRNIAPRGHHVLGWDTPSGTRTSVGRGFDREQTIGHLGFTGTSLWIDRRRQRIAVLLTNRVYPTRENPLILDFRIAFHETVIPPTS